VSPRSANGAGTSVASHPVQDPAYWPQERVARWSDGSWWDAQIDAVVQLAAEDPRLCNLRVTLAHHELACALRRLTGDDSGASFHTWAVWGSKKAGSTIRQEDVRWLRPAAAGLGGLAGGGATAAARRRRGGGGRTAPLIAATLGAGSLRTGAGRLLTNASSSILEGNVTVLDDIGRQTARFVSTFWACESRDEDRLTEFSRGLRPGETRNGGQELLRHAYEHYLDASLEDDPERRDEHMLLANLLAILHEHWRLEPYIDASIPPPFRRLVTGHLLRFTAGSHALSVSRDVPGGAKLFPKTLRTIENAELEQFLYGKEGWDRTPDTVRGSAAGDWTEIADRMNFICDLFRTRHADPSLFDPPYSAEQRDLALAGQMPPAPL
jgi:hypothetical protein